MHFNHFSDDILSDGNYFLLFYTCLLLVGLMQELLAILTKYVHLLSYVLFKIYFDHL